MQLPRGLHRTELVGQLHQDQTARKLGERNLLTRKALDELSVKPVIESLPSDPDHFASGAKTTTAVVTANNSDAAIVLDTYIFAQSQEKLVTLFSHRASLVLTPP